MTYPYGEYSGFRAAYYVLKGDISDRSISDLYQFISFLHHPPIKNQPAININSPYLLKSELLGLNYELSALNQRVQVIENENRELKSVILKFTQKEFILYKNFESVEHDNDYIAPDISDYEAIELLQKSLQKAQSQQNRMIM